MAGPVVEHAIWVLGIPESQPKLGGVDPNQPWYVRVHLARDGWSPQTGSAAAQAVFPRDGSSRTVQVPSPGTVG